MTELEYVICNFEKHFRAFSQKRIILHGSREYAEAIIGRFSGEFHFIGIMTRDPLSGSEFHGIPLYSEDELTGLAPDLVILTERVKYAEAVYQDLHGLCEENGALLFNMYGVDEIAAHREIENSRPLTIYGWEKICSAYQIVVFESPGVIFEEPQDVAAELTVCVPFYKLAQRLMDIGIEIKFSLRKSFPEDAQIRALKSQDFFTDTEKSVIRREGPDLSFRKLREENPDKKILYIGWGVVNECLLPRCYGIDTRRALMIPEYGFRDCSVPVGETQKPMYPETEILREPVLKQIREHDIISFDVFDTLLARKTLYPADVFPLVECRIVQKGIPAENFTQMRIEAGNAVPHASIDDIYEWLAEKYGWDPETASSVRESELRTEFDVTFPREEIVSLMNYAVSIGKQVVLTSDMYLPAPVLGRLLKEKGITGWSRLFVSCDYGKSKETGLFGDVCGLRKDGESILHIGDNETADGFTCGSYGIDAVIIPSSLRLAEARGWKECVFQAKTWHDRCLLGFAIASLFADPFQKPDLRDRSVEDRLRRFGKGITGPLITAYLCWLINRFRRMNYDAVLFLSRDGWLLSKIYDKLRNRYDLPRSVYCYLNRHASFLCCADDPAKVRYAADMAEADGLTACETLSRVYDIPPGLQFPAREGETVEDCIIRHMPVIVPLAEKARIGLRRYFDICGLSPDGNYALVDFIAKGTTQLFTEQALGSCFKGFCFANYWPEYRRNNTTEDYLLTEKGKLLNNYIELESFITSPEPSVDHISEEGEVMFSEEVRSEKDLCELRIVLEESEKTALEFFDLFYQEGGLISPDLIDEMFAADGCHWVQRFAWNDWSKSPIPARPWQNEG